MYNIFVTTGFIELRRMLVVSHEVVFIKNEAVLQCTTMQERARAFAATTEFVTFLI